MPLKNLNLTTSYQLPAANMSLGLRLAAIYGFPPSRLGFCGKGTDKNLKILSKFIAKDASEVTKLAPRRWRNLAKQTRKILSGFEAAFSYYKLIARCNKIADPFDQKVVEAYWIGNKLLEKIPFYLIERTVLSEFTKPSLLSKKRAKNIVKKIPKGVVPHHSFHVLFIGSITGRIKLTNKLLDVCRVGWGRVKNVKCNLTIKYKPLIVKNNKYYLDKVVDKKITWDRRFLSKLKTGDIVSFHWDKACQVLTKKQEENLEKYTRKNLDIFNEPHR